MTSSKENTQELQQQLDREVLQHRITNRIRQSLDLQEILTATVAEIRSFLATDRVMVYRFHPDSSGEVIAESIYQNRLPSLMGLNFPADDIPPEARERFVKQRVRSIVDVRSGTIGLSTLDNGADVAQSNPIYYRLLDSCHATYLTAMGVNSSLVVPILHQKKLWGLLVSHNVEPRRFSEEDLQLVQQVADQVSIAISQSTLLTLARERQHREATVNRIAALLHARPTIELQAALEATVEAMNAIGGRLYLSADEVYQRLGQNLPQPPLGQGGQSQRELFTSGTQPDTIAPGDITILEDHPLWREWMENVAAGNGDNGTVVAISDLYKSAAFVRLCSAFRNTPIRGLLVVPLFYRQKFLGTLSVFRAEMETERLWAGRFDTNLKQLMPRRSFEAWRELKKGQTQPWTTGEIQMAGAIGDHLAMAIEQYFLYKQVRQLNANLEQQVQQRTAELRKSLEQTRVLGQILEQIRSTLDKEGILQTIVREVRSLLYTDRVAIYQFAPDGGGVVTVEDRGPNWASSLGITAEEFSSDSLRFYASGQVRIMNHVAEEILTPCHRSLLESLQVKACLIVPIRYGQSPGVNLSPSPQTPLPQGESEEPHTLWGLLIVHHCGEPRGWQPLEIDFLQHLASQAAIAIQQAELYEQSKTTAQIATDKAKQLAAALEELQEAQTHLIQSEKMSALGQLVAGIAHEINNPVNFIYGNLLHASEYTDDLLALIKLYRNRYLQPSVEIQDKIDEIDFDFLIEDLPKMLASMKVGAERIRQIVLSLRNFSRIEQTEMKAVDIHDGIDSTLMILHHRLKAKPDRPAIQIVTKYGNLPLVECYAGQLNQVFMNVLSNAIDALEEFDRLRKTADIEAPPSQITIKTDLIESQSNAITPATNLMAPFVRIKISDNGPGIPPSVRDRIFEPFFTTKEIGKGTGMGLSISHQIVVEKHGGNFMCLSEPGQGTDFLIELPLNQSQVSPISE
ncbi:MAG: hypothetical protein Fur0025_37070 [Oscillatoriaceae cyanobacterium]